MDERFSRHLRLFGQEGQRKLAATCAAVVGIGGLGTHVVQQLALLGVGHLVVIDGEDLDRSNLNRYVTARHDDPIPGTRKVEIAARLVRAINPTIVVTKVDDSFVSQKGFDALIGADHVLGCVDTEGARFILNEVCAAYSRPYFDLSSEIIPGDPPEYGGQICVAWDGKGCIVCCKILDLADAQDDLSGTGARRNRAAIYGLNHTFLEDAGPSVVSIN